LLGSVLAELAILVAVLGVAAVLVNEVPARQAASLPYSQIFDVLGVQVNAVVSPARPGPGNEFHFYVLGADGQPKAIPELDARLSLPSRGIGPLSVPVTVVGPGHYQNNQVIIPFAGDWDLDLTVRTSPVDEQQVRGVIPVH
jgi:copper transport protein